MEVVRDIAGGGCPQHAPGSDGTKEGRDPFTAKVEDTKGPYKDASLDLACGDVHGPQPIAGGARPKVEGPEKPYPSESQHTHGARTWPPPEAIILESPFRKTDPGGGLSILSLLSLYLPPLRPDVRFKSNSAPQPHHAAGAFTAALDEASREAEPIGDVTDMTASIG